MVAIENKLKAALARNDVQIGMWIGLRNRTIAEIAATAGFDWCLIDGEHGPYDISAIEGQLQIIGQHVPAVVRVPDDEPWMIKQVLDIGAQNILVPMVDTAAQAAKVVRAAKYPPAGHRGMAAAVVRASQYNANADYARQANDNICILVQAETVRAMENIDEIANTDGVDCVFIGPADLASDMGLEMDAPKVAETIDHMIARIRAAGKSAGILTFDPKLMKHYANQEVSFLAVGSDVFGIAGMMRDLAVSSRNAVSD